MLASWYLSLDQLVQLEKDAKLSNAFFSLYLKLKFFTQVKYINCLPLLAHGKHL